MASNSKDRASRGRALAQLDPAQQAAVRLRGGPMLVLAGAGSGKTRVITYRIACLIAGGVPPERICAVTFTNKAAQEMQQRVSRMLGRGQRQRPLICTFHSLCVRILRRHAERLGYPQRFLIFGTADQESVMRGVSQQVRAAVQLSPKELLDRVGRWKNDGVMPQAARRLADEEDQRLAAAVYAKYQVQMKQLGAVDFDDLLMLTEQLFRRFPKVRREEAARFDHLLIDEYQDTNATQYRLALALARDHGNLCVVGDDDQSIYGWRGAQLRHILDFQRDWPDAKVVRLETNYRSSESILAAASQLIAFNRKRHAKNVRSDRGRGERPEIVQYADESQEARQTVLQLQARLSGAGREPRDFAILFRTNEQPRALETELRKTNLPYVLVGAGSFFDRKEVKDILAYLRMVASPRDELALRRIINIPARGVGSRALELLVEHARDQQLSLWDAVRRAGKISGLSQAARAGLDRLARIIGDLQGMSTKKQLARLGRRLLQETRYEQEIERAYAEPLERQARWTSVEQLINAIAQYEKDTSNATLQGFLDQMALDERPPQDDKEQQLRRNAIALMTLHSSKGLEFSEVFIVGLEEGTLPHHRSIEMGEDAVEEERRLCYVGMTRAQDRLTLSLCLSRLKWGKPRETMPSRFLYEITGQTDNAKYQQCAGN